VAEWLHNGLQNRVHRFNSGRGLQHVATLLRARRHWLREGFGICRFAIETRFVIAGTGDYSPPAPRSNRLLIGWSLVRIRPGEPNKSRVSEGPEGPLSLPLSRGIERNLATLGAFAVAVNWSNFVSSV
jgi:hypothetical protein